MATNTLARTTVGLRATPLLRWALEIDGAVSALNGLVYLIAAAAIGDLLDLPTALLVPAGGFLVLYGAVLVAWVLMQAVVVTGFAAAQLLGLRRANA